MIQIPPYLKKGDTIGITCSAGYMEKEKAQLCIDTLQQWGFEVMVGKTLCSHSNNYFSATDEERVQELQAMLDSDSINAILFGRGGYGMSRIIDQLNFTAFRKKPKWIIGYSDITLLHAHIHSRYRIATLHAPMAGAFNDGVKGNAFIASLQKAIMGKKARYKCATHALNKKGTAEGELIGGNLTLLAHITGTRSAINTKGKILFIEDVGEYIYNIDRMLYQLKRSGNLNNLAGLIVGKFTDSKDTTRPFGQDVFTVISELVQEYSYPVCFDFPVSHSKENYALKTGVLFRLTVTGRTVQLAEK